jgi:glycosyltransferase involved in cell wall biosynthesis
MDHAVRGRSPTKVLHVRSGDGMYGAEMVVLTLAKVQRKQGVDARVLCLERPGRTVLSDRFRDEGIPVERVVAGGRLDLGAAVQIRRILERLQPDVVHAHDYKSDLILAVLRPRLAPRLALVATNHLWTQETPLLRLYEQLDALGMRRFDRVVGVSAAIREEMIRAGVAPQNVAVVVNGLDHGPPLEHESTTLRRELGLSDATAIVGFVGRLSVQKGLPLLLQATERLRGRDLHVVIVGEGPQRGAIEAELTRRELTGRVTLLGRREDASALMRAFDVMVLPSIREGTPLVLLEAMAQGTAVVASRVGGVADVVQADRTGLLFESGDVDGLVTSLDRLVNSAPERARLGTAAMAHVRDRFSAEAMAAQYSALYDELVLARRQVPSTAPVGQPAQGGDFTGSVAPALGAAWRLISLSRFAAALPRTGRW